MTAFDPDPNLRWLFCMTHPDDEISICAWIKRLTEVGADVYMSWTHDTPVRQGEAEHVARALGVRSSNLVFHHAPDRTVLEHVPRLLGEFRSMMEGIKPDRVCCGAFEQGHIDHDTTNFLVNQCFKGPVFEIPFYYTYLTRQPTLNRFADPAGEEVIHLTQEERKLKLRIAKSYPSQAIWRNLVLAEMRHRLMGIKRDHLRDTERMRLQTHRDFLTPNLPERYARRVRRSRTWLRWEATIRAILLANVQTVDGASGPALGPGSDR